MFGGTFRSHWRRLATAGATLATGGATAAACMPIPQWAAQPPPPGKAAEAVAKYEDSADWVRADVSLAKGGEGHVIFDTLGAKINAVPMYRIYARRDGTSVAALASEHAEAPSAQHTARLASRASRPPPVDVSAAAEGCDGHKGIVHGGLTAMLFDNTLGWANVVAVLADGGALAAVLAGAPDLKADKGGSPARFGFTANLSVNYRAPLKNGSTVEMVCKVDRVEGRKRFLVGEMRDVETGALIADCTSLFVIPRAPPAGG